MIWLVLLTGGIYIVIISAFFYGWRKLKPLAAKIDSRPFLSVIVPMRNEQSHISMLLQDLNVQDYSKSSFEIIVIDDHSADESLQMAANCAISNIKIRSLPDSMSGKKAAIHYGIDTSRGELILTTDADCRVGTQWLSSMATYYSRYHPAMILAPVAPIQVPSDEKETFSAHNEHWKGAFYLELFSLLGSTAGSAAVGHPVMCNGANLAFPRTVYPDIEDLYKNQYVKSGDDIFVMLELKKRYPGRIHYFKSKEATVYTAISSNLSDFLNQRGRWASKSKYYRDPSIIITALVVLGINFLLTLCLVLGIIYHDLSCFLLLLLLKSAIDFPFLYSVTSFFERKKLMWWFPFVQSLYFLYVCITVGVAVIVPLGWKGRRL
jgi:poly-beta-1,6-N-acetyl-D-glucosamine synthase